MMLLLTEADELVPTRSSLLSRLKNLDDQESWRVFFETYWKLIFRYGLRSGLTPAEAEDVVQETVIYISKKIGSFDYDPAKGSFKAYLFKLTKWRIKTQLRKRLPVTDNVPHGDEPDSSDSLEELAAPVPPEVELWDTEWEKNLLDAAVQRAKSLVHPKLYQAYDLYVHQEWPASKVARDLRLTRAAVYLAKHRIGKLIKNEIERLRTEPLIASEGKEREG